MRIRIEVEEDLDEDEIIIRCGDLTKEIYRIQKILLDEFSKNPQIIFYKDGKDYYIDLEGILFFESYGKAIHSHTRNDFYEVNYKLYELEEILPRNFIRVSKSTIVNTRAISSITREISSSSLLEFQASHKTSYVSRFYYKDLKYRLEEVRR